MSRFSQPTLFPCDIPEEASSLLANQEESRKQGQSEIIEDITKVKDNIQHVWSRVGQLLHH